MKPEIVQVGSGFHNEQLAESIKKKYDSAKYKEWYKANAGKKLAAAKAYYEKNSEARIAASKAYREKNPRCWTNSHRKRLYGIDDIEFSRMLIAQSGKCAICDLVFDSSRKRAKPHIDHDHGTGLVRGLLCMACNTTLGRIERPGFLESASKYLETNEAANS